MPDLIPIRIGTSGTTLKHYYVRQLRDLKGSMSVPLMDPLQLGYYGRLERDYQRLHQAVATGRVRAAG